MHDILENGIGQEPPVVGGAEAVFAGARVKVVRTRMLTGALSVAAVLGVAAGAASLGGGGTGHGGAGQAVAPAAGGSQPTTAPTSAAQTGPTEAPPNATAQATAGGAKTKGTFQPAPVPGPGEVLIDGRTAADLLKQMLPAGLGTSHVTGQDTDPGSGVNVNGHMALTDAQGHVLGAIGVNVQQNMGSLLLDNCTGDCTVLPDGSQLTISTVLDDKPTVASAPKTVDWTASRVFLDGHRIVVDASNYFDDLTANHEKGWTTTTTGHDPAVGFDKLKEIVGDPRWTLTVTKEAAAQAKKDVTDYTDLATGPTAVGSSAPKG